MKLSEVWKQARDEIIEKLELNERGNVKKSRMNCLVILREDPVLRGRIKSNLFTERIDLCDLPWNRATHTLDDNDVHHIYLILEAYGVVNADSIIDSAIRLVADENRYHPVREFLESLVWDIVDKNKVFEIMIQLVEQQENVSEMHVANITEFMLANKEILEEKNIIKMIQTLNAKEGIFIDITKLA